jgi:tape measure domain-containing protein
MAAPELRLNVTLDLVGFRGEMRKLVNVAQSEFTANLNLKFNRAALDAELNNVQRAISRRVFRAELTTNFEAELLRVKAIKRELAGISGSPVYAGVGASGGQEAARRRLRTMSVDQLRREARGLGSESRTAQQVNLWLDKIVKEGLTGRPRATQLNAVRDFLARSMVESVRGGISARYTPGQARQQIGQVGGQASTIAAQAQAMARAAQEQGAAVLQEMDKTLRPQNLGMKISSLERNVEKLDAAVRGLRPEDSRQIIADLLSLKNELAKTNRSLAQMGGAMDRVGDQGVRSATGMGSLTDSSLRLSAVLDAAGRTIQSRVGQFLRRSTGSGVAGIGGLLPGGPPDPFFGGFGGRRLSASTALAPAPRTMALPPSSIAGFLPPSAQSLSAERTARADEFARRTAQAQLRSAFRGMDVMGENIPPGRPPMPYRQGPRRGGAIVPHSGVQQGFAMPSSPMMGGAAMGASKMDTALKSLSQSLNQSRVPLSGAIQELGGQFVNATKQVLLYGTAYKGLAFLMNMPREAFEATKALQLFENQMRAITGSAAEADQAFNFVDDLSKRFALPLQSARQGFAQLYASMSPAGIPAGDIETLFTGMANAAATFGFSSAEMDRMTLAFSQMASKGKIMTEEVTRQLGDVLPGALALMARAAQMEIADFIDAMQRGQLSGEAMKAVMFNVGIIMQKEFGGGAQNAAVLLRGAMNDMGNAVTRMYEAFRPLVEDIAAKAIPAITKAVESATDGIKVFVASFTGADAPVGSLNSTATTVAQTLQSLNEIFKALGSVAMGLGPSLGFIAQSLLSVLEQVARFINTDFGGWLVNVTAQALLLRAALIPLAQVLGLNLLPKIVAVIAQLNIFIGAIIATAKAKGVATAATFAFTGALKLLLIPLLKFAAPVAIVTGIMAIADAFGSASKRARELRAAAIDATQAIRGMSTTEAIQAGRTASSDIQSLRAISGREDVSTRRGFVAVSAEEKAALERAGISTTKQVTGGRGASGIVDVVERNRLTAATLSAEGRKVEADFRVRQNKFEEQQASQALRPVELQGADDAAGSRAAGRALGEYDGSQLEFLKQQLKLERQTLEARLQQNLISETAFKTAVAELEFEAEKAIIAEELRLRALAANRENLSAADKILKIKDLEIIAENKLRYATEQRAIVLDGIKKELAGPILDANEQNNEQISEQNMLLGRLADGHQDLSLEQKAILEVGKLTNKLSGDQLGQLREEIALLEKSTMERIKNDQAINYARRIGALQNEIQLLLTANDVERERLRIRQEFSDLTPEQQLQIINLEEIKKKIENVRAMIDDLVSSTVSDYKGFFKSVLFGEDPVDALKEFQKRLADKTLTLFLDFAMAPVEQFFKENLFNLFKPEESKEVAAATSNTSALDKNTAAIEANTAAQGGQGQASAMTINANGLTNAAIGEDIEDNLDKTGNGLNKMAEDAGKAAKDAELEGNKWKESLNKTVGAVGIAAGSIMGIAAGISQIKEGGASNVLGGIGSVLMGVGGAMGGFGKLFGANGGVAAGGWKPFPVSAFANGGVVNGPTLGLVGEGKFNEAIVPLPDGRSIPVKMAGSQSPREAMETGGMSSASNSSVLSLSFETTNIGGVEYVSRDQLELAMAATRKEATREGATRGMNMTIDKIKNSPSTRNSLGIGRR